MAVGHEVRISRAAISASVDMIKELNTTNPCREGSIVLTKLEEAKMWFELKYKNIV